MSSVKIEGNASGTGVFTIASPNSNTNRTLTLPNVTGTFLTSATTTGFPAGSVLQVVQGESILEQSFTSNTTWTAINPSVTITPTSTSSKILILISFQAKNDTSGLQTQARLYRGGSNIKDMGQIGNTVSPVFYISMNYLDSPNSTSSLTYQVYTKHLAGNTGTFVINFDTGVDAGEDPLSTITAMEIAA